ncbi:pentapeptide repeat protein [Calothrix parasitica NIES-267]|uniref:Pentapeptide repeat protein n=1 Tax=Calothrix parasitica NIES-267 TaxID=1973488 RepID=A0A1Z4LVI0_9CYAN|nr:pentapeptide repeat protein [Calothrix parasitica NIES-267]
MAMRDVLLYVLVALLVFSFIELNQKNAQIQSLESILKFAVKKPIYIQAYQHIGDIMSEDNGITITPQGDAVGISIGDDNYQEGVFAKTSGDVANFVNEVEGSRAEASPKIKALFAQIQKTIENNDDLSPDEKNYALQQLKSLESTSSANKRKLMKAESDELMSDASIV